VVFEVEGDAESGCCTHGLDFDLDSGGALDI
jgi:hypothetical protein